MKRASCLGLLVVLAMVVGGCGDPTHDSVTKDMISQMKQFVDVLKGVTDEASAKAAAPKLQAIAKEMQELKKQADKLGQPSKEVEAELKKKYEPEMKTMMTDLMSNMMRVSMDPKLSAPLKDAMAEFGKVQ